MTESKLLARVTEACEARANIKTNVYYDTCTVTHCSDRVEYPGSKRFKNSRRLYMNRQTDSLNIETFW
jgi:hypothetical protein